ncbi:hypothetical protein [Rhizobium sp. BE258]|jgi:hypothetical protein|uniref:hypothetical protein n=1 Tax=Rhizobium sp. BE258 TaxID=2817722 RepID=UPI000DD76926|nr:hypothetical protein [Rhizobium sp. BE258]MDR7147226.1 hypothetical protein [Rhizobium sp. BE258]
MRIKLAATAALFAIGVASSAFAAPMYDDSYVRPIRISPPKPVHYTEHAPPAYSDDYTNDSDGWYQTKMAAPKKINYSKLEAQRLPPCKNPAELTGVQTRAGDGGASDTDACRDVGTH